MQFGLSFFQDWGKRVDILAIPKFQPSSILGGTVSTFSFKFRSGEIYKSLEVIKELDYYDGKTCRKFPKAQHKAKQKILHFQFCQRNNYKSGQYYITNSGS